MAINVNDPNFAAMRKAIQYGFGTDGLHGLAIHSSVGPRCNNNPNDVEIVSWLLFFYFQTISQTMIDKSDVHVVAVDNKLNHIMHHTTNFTPDHEWLIRAFQRTINVSVTGIIVPQSIEHIILSYEIIGFASIIGDYDCKGIIQYIDALNPHQLRNEVIATSTATLAILVVLFSRTLRGGFTESILMALAKKKIPKNIQKQIGAVTEGGLNKVSNGWYSHVKTANNWIENMRNPGLKKLFQIGLIVGGVGGVAGYMYHANTQCKANLKNTIDNMSADVDNWKRKYDEAFVQRQEVDKLYKQQEESDKRQQEMQREIQQLIKNKSHTFNKELKNHIDNLSFLKDSAISSGKYWS